MHGYAAADVIDASALVPAALASRLRLAVAGRYSYLDKVLTGVSSEDVGDFVPIPRYDDYQARASLALRKDEELARTFLASDDHLQRTIPSNDPAERRTQNTDSVLQAPHPALHAPPARRRQRRRHAVGRLRSQPLADDLRRGAGRPRPSRRWQYALARRATAVGSAPQTTLSVGLDLQGRSTSAERSGSVTLPAREGDITVFGQPPGDDIAADDWKVHIVSAAAYVAGRDRLGSLTLTPGLRFEPFADRGQPQLPAVADRPPRRLLSASIFPATRWSRPTLVLAPNPRLTAAYRATRRLAFTLGAGLYHQPPEAEDLSAVFGNPTLGLSRAIHLLRRRLLQADRRR